MIPSPVAAGRLRTAVLAGDPDGARLRLAARAVLTAASAAFVVSRLPVAAPAVMLGGAMGMMSQIAVNDPDVRRQQATFLLLPLAAGAAIVAAALLSATRWGGVIGFIVVVFAAVASQRFGPRGRALGILGFNAYFFTIFSRATVHQLGPLVAGAGVGLAIGFVVRFAIIRDRPAAVARRLARALPVLSSAMIAALARAVRDGRDPRSVPRVRRALRRLNEAALMLEDHVDRHPQLRAAGLAQRAFAQEIAGGRIFSNAGLFAREADAPLRAEVAAALAAAAGGDLGAARARLAAIDAGERPLMAVGLERLADALAALSASEEEVAAAPAEEPVAPAAAGPATPPPTLRQAIQAAVACAVATVVGRWISPDRWFWAVLAAYLVIAPATTAGEILVTAWRRTFGTVAGVIVGVLLAEAVRGHARVELGLLFVCMLLGVYSMRVSVALVATWFTAMIAVLYGLIGQLSTHVLWLRIAETAAGAAIGAVTAALVLPSKTHNRVARALGALLAAIAGALERLGAGERPEVRTVDRALRELRLAAEPLVGGMFRIAPRTGELVHNAAGLAFYVRQLATPGLVAGDPHFAAALRALAEAARGLGGAIGGGAAPAPAVLAQDLRGEVGRSHDRDLVVLWLERMATIVDEMRGLLVA